MGLALESLTFAVYPLVRSLDYSPVYLPVYPPVCLLVCPLQAPKADKP